MNTESGPDLFVLCGALGSGKTTLLTNYLRSPDAADTGVIVNEVGEINVDAVLVSVGRPGLEMAYLSNGCVCCSLGNGLKYAVERLVATKGSTGRRLRRIVIETSGLARPGPVVRALSELNDLRLGLRIVTTYDCREDWLERRGTGAAAAATAQIAAANSVVLTKPETVGSDARRRMEGRIGRLNPLARLVSEHDGAERAAKAFATSAAAPRALGATWPAELSSHPDTLVLVVRWSEPAQWSTVEDWLEDLAGFCGDRLLRAKGFLAVAGCRELLLIQGVGTVFDTPRRFPHSPDAHDGLVIIMRDLDRAEFQSFLDAVPGSPSIASSPPRFSLQPNGSGRPALPA